MAACHVISTHQSGPCASNPWRLVICEITIFEPVHWLYCLFNQSPAQCSSLPRRSLAACYGALFPEDNRRTMHDITDRVRRKIPWRLSRMQKARQRKRLRAVDKVVDTVSAALERNGLPQTKSIQRWYAEMPREEEMLPRDKYTIYDRKERSYRKGIHSMFFSFFFFGGGGGLSRPSLGLGIAL